MASGRQGRHQSQEVLALELFLRAIMAIGLSNQKKKLVDFSHVSSRSIIGNVSLYVVSYRSLYYPSVSQNNYNSKVRKDPTGVGTQGHMLTGRRELSQ